MKLWTIQPIEVYDILMRDGVYYTNPNKIDKPTFLPSYDWLNKYLEQKHPKPEHVSYPIWAWYRYDGKEKKPDLRHSSYGMRGEQLVCMELEVQDDQVLLSDFDAWHFVLNNWWLDDSLCEEEWDQMYEWFDSLPKDKQQEIREKSWEKIFHITPFHNDWVRKGDYIQAVFWELKTEHVKKVWKFTAR